MAVIGHLDLFELLGDGWPTKGHPSGCSIVASACSNSTGMEDRGASWRESLLVGVNAHTALDERDSAVVAVAKNFIVVLSCSLLLDDVVIGSILFCELSFSLRGSQFTKCRRDDVSICVVLTLGLVLVLVLGSSVLISQRSIHLVVKNPVTIYCARL